MNSYTSPSRLASLNPGRITLSTSPLVPRAGNTPQLGLDWTGASNSFGRNPALPILGTVIGEVVIEKVMVISVSFVGENIQLFFGEGSDRSGPLASRFLRNAKIESDFVSAIYRRDTGTSYCMLDMTDMRLQEACVPGNIWIPPGPGNLALVVEYPNPSDGDRWLMSLGLSRCISYFNYYEREQFHTAIHLPPRVLRIMKLRPEDVAIITQDLLANRARYQAKALKSFLRDKRVDGERFEAKLAKVGCTTLEGLLAIRYSDLRRCIPETHLDLVKTYILNAKDESLSYACEEIFFQEYDFEKYLQLGDVHTIKGSLLPLLNTAQRWKAVGVTDDEEIEKLLRAVDVLREKMPRDNPSSLMCGLDYLAVHKHAPFEKERRAEPRAGKKIKRGGGKKQKQKKKRAAVQPLSEEQELDQLKIQVEEFAKLLESRSTAADCTLFVVD